MDNSADIRVQIRPARKGDAPTIVGWFATHAEAISWGGPAVPENFNAAWFSREITATSDIYRTACTANETIIGICGLRPFPQEQRVHIIRLAVAPPFWRRGAGRLLIADAIAAAGSHGARTVSLNVYGSNVRARQLYEALGFHAAKTRDAPEDSSGVSIYMERPAAPIEKG